jgi:ubiquinone/menaquinone biosynthesis C-methylase UbiE
MRRVKKLLGFGRSKKTAPQSYRDWWNSVSGTMEQAYVATIAPSNETEYQSRGWNGDTNSYGARHFIEKCGLNQASRVLEIGCGIARIGREMAPHVGEWHGADISPNMLGHARERCHGLANVQFHELDPQAGLAALPQAAFDLVYATIVLMHLDKEDVFACLRQARRLLKPDGWAYFDTWNIEHPDVFRIWREAAKLGDAKPRGRVQCSSPSEFRIYLEEAGLDVVQLDKGERLVRAFCRRGVDPPAVADDALPPFGYICRPAIEETVSGTLSVEGWAQDHVVKVEILIDGNKTGETQTGHPRPEVLRSFPRYAPACSTCGFVFQVDTTRLSNGRHEIAAIATDKDGRSTAISGLYQGFRVQND